MFLTLNKYKVIIPHLFLISSCLPLTSRTETLTIDLSEVELKETYDLNFELNENETVYKLEVIAICNIDGLIELNGIKVDSSTKRVVLYEEGDWYYSGYEIDVKELEASKGDIQVKAKFYIQR